VLSYSGPELLPEVHASRLLSVAVGPDRYSVGYSPPGTLAMPLRPELLARPCSRSPGAAHRMCGRLSRTAVARMGGVLYLAAVRSSLARVLMPAEDGCGALGLPYPLLYESYQLRSAVEAEQRWGHTVEW